MIKSNLHFLIYFMVKMILHLNFILSAIKVNTLYYHNKGKNINCCVKKLIFVKVFWTRWD